MKKGKHSHFGLSEKGIELCRKEFGPVEKHKEVEYVSIIYDDKQYSIRIPMKFARSLRINTDMDKFKFLYTVSDKDLKLFGELIRG